jgi:hypothetical protein
MAPVSPVKSASAVSSLAHAIGEPFGLVLGASRG